MVLFRGAVRSLDTGRILERNVKNCGNERPLTTIPPCFSNLGLYWAGNLATTVRHLDGRILPIDLDVTMVVQWDLS